MKKDLEPKKKDTMGQFLTKQPYNLTIAKHTLGIHQMRIMARIVEAVQPSMTMEVDYTKPQEDVWLTLNVSELVVGNNVKPLRLALKKLMTKIVTIMHYIPEQANYLEIGFPIIKEYEYKHGESQIKVQISGKLLPQIIDLARGYTRYSLDVAFKTSSPNVFKLYQYFAHFRDKNQIQCNVETLRQWLQLEDKYAKPGHIKQRILEPAMSELKEKADVWFDIAERVTQGRRMIGWKFNIYKKKTTPLPKKEVPALSEDLLSLRTELVEKYKLSERQAELLLKKVAPKSLRKELYQINLLLLDKKLKNIGGYTAKVLGEKFNIKL